MATMLGLVLAFADSVSALDLTGAWATSADQCDKVFIRNGRANQIGSPHDPIVMAGASLLRQVYQLHDQGKEGRWSDSKSHCWQLG
ncbi:MAG: hypothetical protein Q7V17_21020 [Afipia sp.]|nr:hypothetical protein [Afipia sp.]